MNSYMRPVVVVEKINIGDLIDIKSYNSSKDAHILYVNRAHKSAIPLVTESLESLSEKNVKECAKTRGFWKEKRNSNNNKFKKKVSFSNRSSILYYSEDQAADQLSQSNVEYTNHSHGSAEGNDKFVHTAELSCIEPVFDPLQCLANDNEVEHFLNSAERKDKFCHIAQTPSTEAVVKPSCNLTTNVEVKLPKLSSENEQALPLKELVICVEKLPINLTESVKNENCVSRKCFQCPTDCFENQNSDELSYSQSNESLESKVSESSANILSDDDQEHEYDVQPNKTFLIDKLLEGNFSFLWKPRVLLQRLPNNLLELHQKVYSSETSKESLNSENRVVSHDHQPNSVGFKATSSKTELHDPTKESKLSNNVMHFENEKSLNCNFDVSFKNPFVCLEKLNLAVPEMEDNQSQDGSIEGQFMEENMYYNGQDDNIIQSICNISPPVIDSINKPHITSNSIVKTSNEKNNRTSFQSNILSNWKKKQKSSISHQSKTSNEKGNLKSHLMTENETSFAKTGGNFLLPELAEIISVDSEIISFAPNTDEKCDLSLLKKKMVSETQDSLGHNDLQILQLEGNSDLVSSCCTSEPRLDSYQNNNASDVCSSGEDEIPLSQWCNKNRKNPARLSSISNSEISETCIPTESPSYISDSSSGEDDLPLSLLSKWNNGRETNISTTSRKKIKKSQRNQSSAMFKFSDYNVLHMAEIIPPVSLTSISNKKKLPITSPSKRTKKSNSQKKLFFLPDLNDTDALAVFADLKMVPQKYKKSKAKKGVSSEEIILLPHPAKISWINASTLVAKKVQAPRHENSASNLKSILTDHCYYEPQGAKTISKNTVSPLKKIKLDHNYDLSCNSYRAKQNNLIENHMKQNLKVSNVISKGKKIKSSAHKGKQKKTLDNPDVFLTTYLNKFCSDFDKIGKHKGKNISSSHQKKQPYTKAARKKKENAYNIIIKKLHDHLKKNCSVKKSSKKKKDKTMVNINEGNPVQLPVVKVESDMDFTKQNGEVEQQSSQCAQNETNVTLSVNSKKRKRRKESRVDKGRLGFLTKNRSLRLYNKCLVAERMLLSKYKMKKGQRKKLKKMFNSLKKNSLHTKEL